MEDPDVIVVGGGATGGMAAKELCERGLRVLLVEAGPMKPDPVDEQLAARQPVQSRCLAWSPATAPLWVDDEAHPYATPEDRPFHWFRARVLGGRMRTWGRRCLRLSDVQLRAASRDGHGVDWPLDYATLAPWYDHVERFLRISGNRDGLADVPDGICARPVPFTRGDQRLADAITRELPSRRIVPGRFAMAEHGWMLAAAAKTGRLQLACDAIVDRVETDASGRRAVGVTWIDRVTRARRGARAKGVFLCAGTIETTRLLLLSSSPRHPEGLANSSGALGRYLMEHAFAAGRVAGVIPDLPPGPPLAGVTYLANFRNLDERHPAFVRGWAAEALVDRGPLPSVTALGASSDVAHFSLLTFGEMLADASNRVTLDDTRVDAWGIPVPRIALAHSDNDRALARDARDSLEELARAAGFTVLSSTDAIATPGSSVHELGTARMGTDARSSVLDAHNRAWDVPNLYVTDGACFPSAGHQNPTLTMLALTARAAEHASRSLREETT